MLDISLKLPLRIEQPSEVVEIVGVIADQNDALLHFVHTQSKRLARFAIADLQAKESWSEQVPFKRFKVKVKTEIIRMDHPTICPAEGRAPTVDAKTLARWLDQGRDDAGNAVVMLDTRNDFEVDYGRFENAIDWRIKKFTEFPQAVQAHRNELQGKTIVSYCTGGIRCEKAALYLHELGLSNVVQLDGGILKYFEQIDGRHWQGNCFVFDEREALEPSLSPSKPGA